MDIRDAMLQITKGRKIQRDFWDVGTHVYLDHWGTGGFPLVKVADNAPVNYTPLLQDLLAKDWVVVRHITVNVNPASQGGAV